MIGLKKRIAAYESTAKLDLERFLDREAPVNHTSVKKRISFFESQDTAGCLNIVPETGLRKADAEKNDVEAHLPSHVCSSFEAARSRFEAHLLSDECNSFMTALSRFEDGGEGGTNIKVQPNVIEGEVMVTNSLVKNLVSFFEAKIPPEALPHVDFLKTGADQKHVDVHFPTDSYSSFETAPSRFEEDSNAKVEFCDDDLSAEIVNRIEQGSGTECEIQPNVNPTPYMSEGGSSGKKSNPFIFHINAPATNISDARKGKSKSLRRKKKTVARGMVLKGLANFKDKAAKRKEKKEEMNGSERMGLMSREKVEKETPAQKQNNRLQFFPRMNNIEGQERHGPLSSMLSCFLSHRGRKGRAQQKDNYQAPAIEMEMSVSPGEIKKTQATVGNVRVTISVSATIEGEEGL